MLAITASTASTASAGVYGSLGVGSTSVSDSGDAFRENSRAWRIAGGYRLPKYLSFEAGLFDYGVGLASGPQTYSTHEVFAAGVFRYPIANGFGAFGRVGVQHMSVSNDAQTFAGNGLLLGAGFDFQVKVPGLPFGAVWVDYNRSSASIELDETVSRQRDFAVGMWSLGVSAGF